MKLVALAWRALVGCLNLVSILWLGESTSSDLWNLHIIPEQIKGTRRRGRCCGSLRDDNF